MAPPSQAALAAGFALGMVEEMIPPAARPVAGIGLGGAIGVVLIGLFYLLAKACSG